MSIGIATQPGQFAAAAAGGGGPWSPPSGLTEWHYGSATEAGGEWTDRSGNGNHAALNGSASVGVDGLTGTAAADNASIGATLTSSTIHTLCAWVYMPAGQTGDLGLFGDSVNTFFRVWMDVTSGRVWAVATFPTGVSGATPTDRRGTWFHVALASDGDFRRVYINGSFVSDGGDDTMNAGLPAKIGVADGGKPLGGGKMDDVMIFNTTNLSAAQVLDIYTNSPGSHA